MHGYGLLFLLNKRFRDLSAALAERKPLEEFISKDRWVQVEGLSHTDVFVVALYRVYHKKFLQKMEDFRR